VLTRYAVHIWKEIGQEDGFSVVLVAAENVTGSSTDEVRDGALPLTRFRDIATAEGLPFLDLYPEFLARGDPESAHWRTDGHWNEHRHRWAADAVFEFLVGQGVVPGKPPARLRVR
jgi:hypothetical protein